MRKIDKAKLDTPHKFSAKISKRLKQAQGQTGISRADLVRFTGLSAPTVDNIVEGYLLSSVYNLKLVADQLSVPMKELF